MNHTLKLTEKSRNLFGWIISLTAFALLIYGGDTLSEAAREALLFAAEKLVPSMFLFAVATGMTTALPSPVRENKLPLLSLTTSALPSLAIGLFSGFPMGAYAARRLYDYGTLDRKSAEHLAAFANNASFAFVYFTVGGLLQNRRAGLLLFFCGTLASLTVGILTAPRNRAIPQTKPLSSAAPPFFSLITNATVSAANAMLILCGYLTLFGALAKALSLLNLPKNLFTAVILFLEPTAAVRHLATLPHATALPLIAFALGFSGFSILLQSISVFKNELSFARLFTTRLAIGLVSALLMLIFSPII